MSEKENPMYQSEDTQAQNPLYSKKTRGLDPNAGKKEEEQKDETEQNQTEEKNQEEDTNQG